MKKRYMFTLTEAHVERFRAMAKTVNLPPATLSNAIDEFVRDVVKAMEMAQAKGKFGIRDFLGYVGEQIELIQEAQKDEKPASKAKKVAK